MCIIDCLSTIVFILPLHLDYTKVIILILWWRNFQLEYWRTFQLVSTDYIKAQLNEVKKDMIDKGEYIPKVIFINGKHQPSASAPSYKNPTL